VTVRNRLPVLVPLLALVLLGCQAGGSETGGLGQPGEESVAREGLYEPLGGLEYNVKMTRQLNLADPEDSDYVSLPPAEPDSTYFGVFLQACNAEGDPAVPASGRVTVHDTQGNEFRPIPLPPDNVFAYQPERVSPGECLPNANSLAAQAPTGGALLVFEIPIAATENRPLELEIHPPAGAGGEEEEEALRIQLDI